MVGWVEATGPVGFGEVTGWPPAGAVAVRVGGIGAPPGGGTVTTALGCNGEMTLGAAVGMSVTVTTMRAIDVPGVPGAPGVTDAGARPGGVGTEERGAAASRGDAPQAARAITTIARVTDIPIRRTT